MIGREIENIESARALAAKPRFDKDGGWDFWQIVDMATWKVIEVGGILGNNYREELLLNVADPDKTWMV